MKIIAATNRNALEFHTETPRDLHTLGLIEGKHGIVSHDAGSGQRYMTVDHTKLLDVLVKSASGS